MFSSLVERRGSIEDPRYPLSGAALAERLELGGANDAGVTVNEQTVWGVSAYFHAVRTLAGSLASSPIHVVRRGTKRRVVSRLIEDPHPEMTWFELFEWAWASRFASGNAYFWKQRNDAGVITALLPIPSSAVRVGRTRNGDMPGGKVFEVATVDGGRKPASTFDILHLPGFGYDGVTGLSPVRIGAQSFALALAAEKHGARLFGSGSLISGILQTEQRLDEATADALSSRWRSKIAGIGRSHDVVVLGSGTSFQPISMTNVDAQFLESRRFSVVEVCRWFGLPPHMLFETDRSTSWGTGIQSQAEGFVRFNLRFEAVRIEERITKELLPASQQAKVSMEGLLRGDSKGRAEWYRIMREIGAYNVDEIRDLEDLEPLPDGQGQTYVQPLNMGSLSDAAVVDEDDREV